jgi:hypothetical protein
LVDGPKDTKKGGEDNMK